MLEIPCSRPVVHRISSPSSFNALLRIVPQRITGSTPEVEKPIYKMVTSLVLVSAYPEMSGHQSYNVSNLYILIFHCVNSLEKVRVRYFCLNIH